MKLDNFLRKITDKQSLIILGPTNLSEKDLDNLQSLESDTPMLIIDGGLNHIDQLSSLKQYPIFTIGDNDSNKTERLPDILLEVQKDFSDLSCGLSLISDVSTENPLKVTMLGFLGGRLDHEIINLGEISSFLKSTKSKCDIYISNKVISTNQNTLTIDTHKSFSVISFHDVKLTITGECEFTLPKSINLSSLSSRALSNKGFGKVTIKSNDVFFVILNETDD